MTSRERQSPDRPSANAGLPLTHHARGPRSSESLVAAIYCWYLLVLGLALPPVVLLAFPGYEVYYGPEGNTLPHTPIQALILYLFNYLVRDYPNTEAVWRAYGSIAYSTAVMAVLYRILLRKRVIAFESSPLIEFSERKARITWLAAMIATIACGLLLYVQNGWIHPVTQSLSAAPGQFNVVRAEVYQRISLPLYGISVQVFCAAALSLALFALKRPIPIIVSIFVAIWLVSFSLAKASLPFLALEVLIVRALIGPVSRRHLFRASAGVLAGMLLLVGYTVSSTDGREVVLGFIERLALGQFADLPRYFLVFAESRASPQSLLPPYVQQLLGISLDSPGRTVMLAAVSGADAVRGAGTASTFFTGEAFAVLGWLGAALAPWFVFLNIYFVVTTLTRYGKTFATTLVLGFLLYKLMIGMFSGLSVYLLSGIHIVFVGYVLWLVLARRIARGVHKEL